MHGVSSMSVARGGRRAGPGTMALPAGGTSARDIVEPFALASGPVMAVSASGEVLAANPRAVTLGHALAGGEAEPLGAAVAEALAEGEALAATLVLGEGDDAAIVEFEVLPVTRPETRGGVAALVVGRDVTVEEGLRQALTESRDRFRDLAGLAGDFVWETDHQGRFTMVSSYGALGWGALDLIGADPAAFVPQGDLEAGIEVPFRGHSGTPGGEIRFLCADGRIASLDVRAVPVRDADGNVVGARGVARDVSESREREMALAAALERERLVAEILSAVSGEASPATVLRSAAETVRRALAAGRVEIRPAVRGVPIATAGNDAAANRRPLEVRAGGDGVDPAGRICVWRAPDDPRRAWRENEIRVLEILAIPIGIAVERARDRIESHAFRSPVS